MGKELLEKVVNQGVDGNLNSFFCDVSNSYVELGDDLTAYDDERFANFRAIGEIVFNPNEKLVVVTARVLGDLTERSGKKAQYEKAKKILKDFMKYDAGIFVFSDAAGSFRFSLVYGQAQGTKRVFSNFRRFTYFVSRDQTNKTFYDRVGKCDFASLDVIKDAFSVEKVNKEFYQQIARYYYRLTGKNGYKKELVLPSVGEGDERKYEEFAVRLIGRIIFCWFLRHKKSSGGIPLIPREVLSLGAAENHRDYYHSILEPLFFEVMNRPVKERKPVAVPQAGLIPFLNGGLFEPHRNDYYEKAPNYALKIPDRWFADFFSVLEQYNFTIDENSTVDADVSVDPEMLGRIFENLLAEVVPETGETARKATGSYYTPRAIVDYMVEQSLKQYLLTKTSLPEHKLDSLLSYEDSEIDLSDAERNAVVTALKEIKVIDPACGSGAFPMGILHRMLLVLEKVDPRLEIWKRLYLGSYHPVMRRIIEDKLRKGNEQYIRKLTIIQDSIYGVDIQPIAVEIAKLRCFLSLVVDEIVLDSEENRGIEPLPNLEFKFVAANTLIGLPPRKEEQGGFGSSKAIEKLKELRGRYLRVYGKEKAEIEKEFRDTQRKLLEESLVWKSNNSALLEVAQKLTEWDPFSYESCGWFDPGWMFGVEDGFDIVIANPPWGIDLGVVELSNLRKLSGVNKAFDSSEAFVFVGNNFLTENGVLTYIVPKSIIFANDWRFSRNHILGKQLRCLGDCGISFEAVNLESVVIAFRKIAYSEDKNNVEIVRFEPVKRFSSYKELKRLQAIDQYMMIKSGVLILSEMDEVTQRILRTIQKQAFLEDIPREVFRGMYISDSVKASISGKGKYLFVNKVPDVSMYAINKVIRIDLSKHLECYKDIINKLSRDRVVIKVMRGNRLTCAFAPKTILTTEKLVNLVLKDSNFSLFYVLALLNSKLCSFYLNKVVFSDITETSRVMDDPYLKKCPVPKIALTQQHPFIELVGRILAITSDSDYPSNPAKQARVKELQNQIDRLVYELYGLTEEEIGVVEGTFKK
jgi:hypothetical protein